MVRLAGDSMGRAIAAWCDPGTKQVIAVRYDRARGWADPMEIAADPSWTGACSVDAEIAPDGTAIVVASLGDLVAREFHLDAMDAGASR